MIRMKQCTLHSPYAFQHTTISITTLSTMTLILGAVFLGIVSLNVVVPRHYWPPLKAVMFLIFEKTNINKMRQLKPGKCAAV